MKRSAYFFYLLLLWVGCQKKDIAPTAPVFDLIVEGGINSLNDRQYIRLTKPAGLSEATAQPVSGALVSVNDGNRNIVFAETSTSGVYSGVVKHNKNYDSAYTLQITYQGKTYQASDTLTQVVPIAASYLPLTVKKDSNTTIAIPKHIFGVSDAQQWLMTPKGNFWDPSQLNVGYNYNYAHVYGTPNALNPLTQQKRTLNFALNDSIIIYKFSLSFSYSTFLYNLFQETDWKGLLSPNPSNVRGNISGNANGYFYVTDVEMETKAVKDLK